MFPRIIRALLLGLCGAALTMAQAPGALSSWKNETALTAPRARLGSVAHNGYLYALGGYYQDEYGSNGAALRLVEFSRVEGDGTLGAWQATASLPAGILDAGITAYNGRIYVAGGTSQIGNTAGTKTVYSAAMNADGSLGTWQTVAPMLDARKQFNLAAHNGYLYAVGGYNGSVTGVTSKVEYAKINDNGTLGKWTKAAMLPQPAWGAGLVVLKGNLYAVGGYTTIGTGSAVYFTGLKADGNLQGWKTTTSLPTGLWNMGIAAGKENILAVGGALNGGSDETPVARSNSQSVFSAQLNADGSVASWNATTALPAPGAGMGVSVSGGRVYAVGGTTAGSSRQPVNTVLSAQILERPVVDKFTLNPAFTALTLSGSHFNPEASENWVLFQVSGYRTDNFADDYFYVRPSAATATSLQVTIPAGPMSGKIKVISNGLESAKSAGTFRMLVDGSVGCRRIGPPGSETCTVGGKCNEFSVPGTADCVFPSGFADNAADVLVVRYPVALRTGIISSNTVTLNGTLANQGEVTTNCAGPQAAVPECATVNVAASGTLLNKASILNNGTFNNSGAIVSTSANGIFNGYDAINHNLAPGTFNNNAGATLTLSSPENYGFNNGENSTFTNSGNVSVGGTNSIGFQNAAATSRVLNNAEGVITVESGFGNDGTVTNNGILRACGTGTYNGAAPTPTGTVTTGCPAP